MDAGSARCRSYQGRWRMGRHLRKQPNERKLWPSGSWRPPGARLRQTAPQRHQLPGGLADWSSTSGAVAHDSNKFQDLTCSSPPGVLADLDFDASFSGDLHEFEETRGDVLCQVLLPTV